MSWYIICCGFIISFSNWKRKHKSPLPPPSPIPSPPTPRHKPFCSDQYKGHRVFIYLFNFLMPGKTAWWNIKVMNMFNWVCHPWKCWTGLCNRLCMLTGGTGWEAAALCLWISVADFVNIWDLKQTSYLLFLWKI